LEGVVPYGFTTVPPNVTLNVPFEAKDHPSAPLYVEHRDPFVPVQNWFELSASPTVLSFDPLTANRHDVFVRNTDVPLSKEKLRSALSMPTLFEIVIVPGLLL